MAKLEISQADGETQTLELKEELLLGRHTDNRSDPNIFPLEDDEVSRYHARLRLHKGEYVVEDLASTNGTVLRGKRLIPQTPYRLRDGDVIQIGHYQLIYSASPTIDGVNSALSLDKAGLVVEEAHEPTRHIAIDAARFQEAATQNTEKLSAKELQTTVKRLQAVSRVGILLGTITDQDELMQKLMDYIFDIFPQAERAFVMLQDSEEDELRTVTVRDKHQGGESRTLSISRSIINEVIQSKHAILSVDTLGDDRFSQQESIINLSIRSLICAPLLVKDEVLGLIQVENFSASKVFSDDDLNIMTGITTQAAISLKNSQLYHSIEQLFEGFIKASVQAIESRDPSTAGHSFRVAEYTDNLAKAVSISDIAEHRAHTFGRDELQEIRYAALLHDFGKVGVREHVLHKAKKLYPEQLELVKGRFRHARASLERSLYQQLVDQHYAKNLSPEEFKQRRAQIEQQIHEDGAQLERFLESVLLASEPTIWEEQTPESLSEICHFRFDDKIGIPDPLLFDFEFDDLIVTRGTLNKTERREIESHVSHTYEFLSLIPWTSKLSRLPEIAYAHHEKLDGSGYPLGLHADRIPIQTRMLTIADIFDALTAGDRPYKKELPTEAALDIMQIEVREKKIDASLFRLFVEAKAYEMK